MLSFSLNSSPKNVNFLTCALGVFIVGPKSGLVHLTWLNFLATPMGSVFPVKGPAAGLQMAVCIDKAVLLPHPCNITQTLSPLPAKIHLFSHANLRIHHLDTCIETMTIMTAWNGSQNNTIHIWTGNFCPKIDSWKWSSQQKLFSFFCQGGASLSCAVYIFIQRRCIIRPPLFCKLDCFNEATEFLLLNFPLW